MHADKSRGAALQDDARWTWTVRPAKSHIFQFHREEARQEATE